MIIGAQSDDSDFNCTVPKTSYNNTKRYSFDLDTVRFCLKSQSARARHFLQFCTPAKARRTNESVSNLIGIISLTKDFHKSDTIVGKPIGRLPQLWLQRLLHYCMVWRRLLCIRQYRLYISFASVAHLAQRDETSTKTGLINDDMVISRTPPSSRTCRESSSHPSYSQFLREECILGDLSNEAVISASLVTRMCIASLLPQSELKHLHFCIPHVPLTRPFIRSGVRPFPPC